MQTHRYQIRHRFGDFRADTVGSLPIGSGKGLSFSDLHRWQVPDPPESRSPVSVAAARAAEVTTIAMEMALPTLAGWWLDRKLDTSPICLATAGGIGLALGLLHLIRFSSRRGGQETGGSESNHSSDRHPRTS